MSPTKVKQEPGKMWYRWLLEEGTRLLTALALFASLIGVFGQAVVDRYIGNAIDSRRYATVDALTKLSDSVDKLKEEQQDTGKVLSGVSSKLDAVVQNQHDTTALLNRLLVTLSTGKQQSP